MAWLAPLEVLRAKFTRLDSTNHCRKTVTLGKNALGSDPVIPKSMKSGNEH